MPITTAQVLATMLKRKFLWKSQAPCMWKDWPLFVVIIRARFCTYCRVDVQDVVFGNRKFTSQSWNLIQPLIRQIENTLQRQFLEISHPENFLLHAAPPQHYENDPFVFLATAECWYCILSFKTETIAICRNFCESDQRSYICFCKFHPIISCITTW